MKLMARPFSTSGRRKIALGSLRAPAAMVVERTEGLRLSPRRSTGTKPILRPGGDTGNVARVRAHLPAKLTGESVALVTAHDLRSWRDGLAKVLAASTVNRTANGLKAALNLMAEHDEAIPNRRAWENGLASLHDAEESRNVILGETAIRTIIGKANEHSAEFGLLVEVAAVTGARISQLSRLEVQDLQDGRTDPRLMMPSSRKGHGKKKIMRRPVPIPTGLAMKLRGIVKAGTRHCWSNRCPRPRTLLAKSRSLTRSCHGRSLITLGRLRAPLKPLV